MGCSRADSLLLYRVVAHSDIPGFYLRRFDLFAITHIWTHIWTHPVLQDTVSFETRKRLLPYIRPVDADVSPLALMNSARLDLNSLSASKEPSNKPGFQDDGLTCLVINLYCVLATC